MKKALLLPLLTSLVFSQFACNPECGDPIFGLEILPAAAPIDYQILITASDPGLLHGRRVYFGDEEAEDVQSIAEGILVTVPQNAKKGDTELKIEAFDCQDFIIQPFEVVEKGVYFNTPDYVVPSMQLYIPTFNPNIYPPSVANAWLHPDETDYCVWFQFVKETLPDSSVVETNTIDPTKSFELAVCQAVGGNPPVHQDPLYHGGKIFGIIDKSLNKVEFTIDRRGIATSFPGILEIEDFTGQFITIPEDEKDWDAPQCAHPNGWVKERNHMMLVRSKQTGRQLLLYQQATNP